MLQRSLLYPEEQRQGCAFRCFPDDNPSNPSRPICTQQLCSLEARPSTTVVRESQLRAAMGGLQGEPWGRCSGTRIYFTLHIFCSICPENEAGLI